MSDRPWHKRYHSDAISGFMGLNLEQRGAYQTILDMLYDRGEPLVDNERLLAGYMNVSLRKYRTMRDQLIEMGKIYVTDNGLISNRRFDKEAENALKTRRKQAENGLKGGTKKAENQKKTNKNNDASLATLEPNSSLPDTRSQKLDRKKDKICRKRISYPDDFSQFWERYPTSPNMSKKEALDAWKRLDADDRQSATGSLPAFHKYCKDNPDYPTIHACRYLSKRRFDGFSEAGTSAIPARTPEEIEQSRRSDERARQLIAERQKAEVH